MTAITFNPSRALHGWKQEDDYSITLVPSTEIEEGAVSGSLTVKDQTYETVAGTATTSKSDCVALANAGNPAVTFESLTPAVCTVNSRTGVVSKVSNGQCTIESRGQTGRRRHVLTISTIGTTTIYEKVTAIDPLSLRAYLRDQQLAAISGVTPGSASQRAHATPWGGGLSGDGGPVNVNNFVRAQNKPGFTALPLDALDEMIAHQSYDSRESTQWRAWISPHHYLTWRGHPSADTPIAVVGDHVRMLPQKEIVVAWSATAWTGTLCRLLPTDYERWLPPTLLKPAMVAHTAISCWSRNLNTYITGDQRWVLPIQVWKGLFDANDPRYNFQKPYPGKVPEYMTTGGDSGSPAWVGINGYLVPIGHTAYAYSAATVHYAPVRSQIDEAMNLLATQNSDPLAGTYAALTVDLTGFPEY